MASGKTISPLISWRGAIPDSDLPATARHVALTLSLHMSERGDSCFPSQSTLSRETGLSERTVREATHVLEQQGWLERHGAHGRARRSYRYIATIPNRQQVPVEDRANRQQVPPANRQQVPPSSSVSNRPDSSVGASRNRNGRNTQGEIESLDAPTAQNRVFTYVGFFAEQAHDAGWEPTERAKARVGREAKALSEAGKSQELICAAIDILARRHRSPAALEGLVGEVESMRNGKGSSSLPKGIVGLANWAARNGART